MRETYEPPTTSPAVPPHDHTHPRHDHTRSRHDHTHPRHSRTHPRHSRVGGNPPRCVQLPKDSTHPAVDRNRHNATETDEPQRKLVPARAHAREATAFPTGTRALSARPHPRHSRSHPRHDRTLPRHSREGGNPSRCAQAAADSTYRLELPVMSIYRTEPVFESVAYDPRRHEDS